MASTDHSLAWLLNILFSYIICKKLAFATDVDSHQAHDTGTVSRLPWHTILFEQPPLNRSLCRVDRWRWSCRKTAAASAPRWLQRQRITQGSRQPKSNLNARSPASSSRASIGVDDSMPFACTLDSRQANAASTQMLIWTMFLNLCDLLPLFQLTWTFTLLRINRNSSYVTSELCTNVLEFHSGDSGVPRISFWGWKFN